MRLLGLNTSHNQSSYDAGYTNEDEAELITTSNVKYIANHNGADTGSDLTDKKNSTKDFTVRPQTEHLSYHWRK